MQDLVRCFQDYLQNDCRYTSDVVHEYLERLPQFLQRRNISSPAQINAFQVADEWRKQRWQITPAGIESLDAGRSSYLLALKEFLLFLESRKICPEPGLSDIIQISSPARPRLLGLNLSEQRRLSRFLYYYVNNDQQRKTSALAALLLHTGLSLREILNLDLPSQGLLGQHQPGDDQGDFFFEGDQLYLRYMDFSGAERCIPVSPPATLLVNFYLENRPQKSRYLFTNTSRKKPNRLTSGQAEKLLEMLFRKAGLPFRKELCADILIATARAIRDDAANPHHSRNVFRMQPETHLQTSSPHRTTEHRKIA